MLSPRGFVAALALVTGCASASAPDEAQPDAGGARPDASPGPTPDASSITPVDAAPAPDAPAQCTPMTTQLLVNPAFDAQPITGWTAVSSDPTDPLISSSAAVIQSAPNVAWLGGITSNQDALSQQVMIPPGTTQLKLTGYYQVKTTELLYGRDDTAKIELVGRETALSLGEEDRTSAWRSFSHTFTTIPAGQTVTLRLSSSNDELYVTSFYFDTLALTATHCP